MRHALALALLAVPLAASAQDGGSISLGVGQQKVITIAGVTKVAIGDPEIADVKQIGQELLITGISEGRTSLLIWRESQRTSYAVTVRKQDPKEVVSEVRALLGDREGIQLRIVGDRVYMDGEALTTDDYERVNQITSLYPSVKSFVRPSNNAKKLAAQNLAAAFAKAGLKSVTPNVIGATIFLEGSVESKEELTKADLMTKALGENAQNLLTVGIKRMVLVEVQFVEIKNNDQINVGIKLPLDMQSTDGLQTTVNAGYNWYPPPNTPPSTLNYAMTGTLASDFAFGFRFDNGYGRTLSQPKLVCASGEKAEFVVGGEVPIITTTANAINVDYKKFGIILRLTPVADKQGNIQTDIDSEISDVDPSLTIRANGIEVPGFKLRQVKTQVTVKHGETIVLSGIFTYDQAKNVSKFPLLGHIPILGELFKSREFVDRKTELAIFVTPKIVNPDSERIRKLIDDAKDLYKSAADQVNFSIFD